MNSQWAQCLADSVLALHASLVLFVVGGLLLIWLGRWRGWRWVDAYWFRLLHLATIAVVVAEVWLGIECPLTTLESWLRHQSGDRAYAGGFIEVWLQRLLFYQAPAWVFQFAYTLFGVAVLITWLRFPPRRRRRC